MISLVGDLFGLIIFGRCSLMMDISTKGRYATRIMVFLAGPQDGPVTNAEIAQAEDISPAYVQQLMGRLIDAGLVRSRRGKGGGFVLGRPAHAISVGDVLRASEGPVAPAPCRDVHDCSRASTCPTRPFWTRTAHMLNELFDNTTIADLAAEDARHQDLAEHDTL